MELKKLQLNFLHFWVYESAFKFLPEPNQSQTKPEEIPIDIDYRILQAEKNERYRIEVSVNSIEKSGKKNPYSFYVKSVGVFELTASDIKPEEKGKLIVRMALPLVISSVRSYITSNTTYSPLRKYYLPVVDMNELIKDKLESVNKKVKKVTTKKVKKLKKDLLGRRKVNYMPTKSPWHSIKQDVHHNNTECNTGNNIETENLRQGDGGKPLCQECKNLNSQGK